MKQRIFSLLLALCMCSSLFACATSEDSLFSDVADSDWYKSEINYVASEGILQGTSERMFSPNAEMSRTMLLTALARMSGIADPAAAAWAREIGLVRSDAQTLTRAELAVILTRYYSFLGLEPDGWRVKLPYTDLGANEDWALEGITYCTVKRVMTGSGGCFCPEATSTRAEAAAVLARVDQQKKNSTRKGLTDEQRYWGATLDAMTIEEDEHFPLISLTKDSKEMNWNRAGDRVLLITWHRYPESYPDGAEVTLSWGDVWTFSDEEFYEWREQSGAGVTDWPRRVKQLLGLAPEKEYTHITALWVKPEDVVRPAYGIDVTAQVDGMTLPENEAYRAWFQDNLQWSYLDGMAPWTRLGYTYDWAEGADEYGLSEFLVRKGATVTVAYTVPSTEFFLDEEKEAA